MSSTYVICIIALMILAAIVRKSAYMDERKNRYFLLSIFFNILTLAGYLGRGFSESHHFFILNLISNYMIYSSGVFCSLFLLMANIGKKGLCHHVAMVLTVITFVLLATNPFTEICFYITADSFYHRGAGYWITMAIAFAFLIMCIFTMFSVYKFVELKKRIYIILLAFLEASAIVLQAMDGQLKVIYIGSSFLLAIYYAFLMEVEGRYDKMTGVYSKRYYYNEIERLDKDSEYCVAMIDGNGLKAINDNFGHEKGDYFISTVGRTLWNVFNCRAKVFRIGGDEFVIISFSLGLNEMKGLIEKFNARLESKSWGMCFKISASAGFVLHESGEDFLETLRHADIKMYECKDDFYKKQNRGSDVIKS